MTPLLLALWMTGCNGDVAITKAKIDDDNDGYTAEVDCDDSHATVNPDAPEVCDDLDNDCNELVDDEPTDGATFFADTDADQYGDANNSVVACEAPDGFVEDDTDCNDAEAAMFPGNTEICDGLDNDCNGLVDDKPTDMVTVYVDSDGDGYGEPATATEACEPAAGEVDVGGDCNDEDSAIHPNAPETDCSDPTDYNCDGSVAYEDADGDGSPACEDCNDQDNAIYPGASEVCNQIDDDCDGLIDDADTDVVGAPTWYRDPDGDGYTAGTGLSLTQCETPTGYAANTGDCDDYDASVNPGAQEICDNNNVDEDCDGVSDDQDPSTSAASWTTWYRDSDGDKYGDSGRSVTQCEAPTASYVANGGDCDDANAAINPGATEICNSNDDDCDGLTDDADPSVSGATTWYTDSDGDGYGSSSSLSCTKPSNGVATGGDCNDASASINPAAQEICDSANTDEDCDGLSDDDDSSVSGQKTWYKDNDGDKYGGSSTTVSCDAPTGYVSANGDCNEVNSAVNPGAQEICDAANTDEDCDGFADDADPSAVGKTAYYADVDGDGYGSTTVTSVCDPGSGYTTTSGDCNDANGSINPAAQEVCDAANTDEDCDGLIDDADGSVIGKTTWYKDTDGDGMGTTASSYSSCDQPSGYVATTGDCDDTRATVYLNAPEICDNYDNDCDGSVDEGAYLTWYYDSDGDGYGGTSTTTACTQPAKYVATSTDCNDNSAAVYPNAPEICDSLDNDCDSSVDEGLYTTWYQDADSDGYGNASVAKSACSQPSGYVSNATDCNDSSSAASPVATEICDGIDNDCDGATDEGLSKTWYLDSDKDTYGSSSISTNTCLQPSGYVATSGDCDDSNSAVNPAATEICDSIDNDCDSSIDEGLSKTWYLDADKDNYGISTTSQSSCSQPSGYVATSGDCDDSNSAVNPAATEICDSIDNDCDSSVDEGVKNTYYKDADGDTYGSSTSSTTGCSAPSGYVSNSTDCDDAVASTNPGASEVCSDSVDNNCNGTVDENCSTRLWTGGWSTADYDTKIYGTATGDNFGYSVAGGDFDNDGLVDLAVGAPHAEYSSTYSNYGVTYVYKGALVAGVQAATTNDDAMVYSTTATYPDLGEEVWAIPDMNADGYDELMMGIVDAGYYWTISAHRGNTLTTSVPYTYDYYTSWSCTDMSGAGDFYSTSSAYLACGLVTSSTNAGVVYVYGDSSTSALVTLNGEASSDNAGRSVDLMHDFNGDGTNDALVGAIGNDGGALNAGAAYVVLGPVTGTFSLSGADMKITGVGSASNLGMQVMGGDISGDGRDDILVGSPYYDYGTRTDAGAVYVFSAVKSGTVAASSCTWGVYGDSSSDLLGGRPISLGDVDGDGNQDLLVTSYLDDGAATDAGAAWLIYGPNSAGYDLSLDYGARWRGESSYYYTGYSSGIIGDTDGDGTDDIVIGGYYADERGYTDHGAVWLFLGG